MSFTKRYDGPITNLALRAEALQDAKDYLGDQYQEAAAEFAACQSERDLFEAFEHVSWWSGVIGFAMRAVALEVAPQYCGWILERRIPR